MDISVIEGSLYDVNRKNGSFGEGRLNDSFLFEFIFLRQWNEICDWHVMNLKRNLTENDARVFNADKGLR